MAKREKENFSPKNAKRLRQELEDFDKLSKTEGDKYKFFMKATPLEQMKEDYLYIMETKNKGVDKSRKRKWKNSRSDLMKQKKYKDIQDKIEKITTERTESNTDQLKGFGPHVPTLLEARDDAYRCGHFTYKPIGSSGACIHLWDPELALAIESCLKGLLQAYCCHNRADERMLQALIKRRMMLDTELLIIQFPTVLTDLEIENAVVANSLTDMRGTETVLLVKNNCVACAPRTLAFTADGDQVFVGHYYLSKNIRPKFLSRDMDLFQTDLEKEDENKILNTKKIFLEGANYIIKNPLKDESNPADSEMDNQKQEKWHFEEKQKEHLDTLTKKKQELDMKEKELEEKMSQKRKINLPRADRRKKHQLICGKMNFDHKNETVTISVQPGEANKAPFNNMRAFSRGECCWWW
ncbi:hypothetical protein E2I00_014693, partial [Balaenoptera physalus]